MTSYKPLARDRSKDLDRLAKRVAELLDRGVDPILCDDLYRRFAKDWQHVEPDLVDTLDALQREIIARIGRGEDADSMVRLYMRTWRANVEVWEAKWRQEIEPPSPPPLPPTRGQKVAAFGAGAVAGHYGYRMAERMIGDLFKPVGTLLRLFK